LQESTGAELSSPTADHVTSARHGCHGDASVDEELTFSDVGAIDLSMKKPRSPSSSPAKPPGPALPACPAPPSKPTSVTDDDAMTDALCSLFSGQQSTYGASEQAALAQLIAGQQLAASGSELPLSLAAAAATAGLFPPIFDGMSSLFYPPSILAALAASATPADTHAGLSEKSLASAGATTTHRRARGRRRGSRGSRNSSVFISSLFSQQSASSASRPSEDVKSGRGRGGRGRQTRGRGRQRGSEPLSVAYLELEVSRSACLAVS